MFKRLFQSIKTQSPHNIFNTYQYRFFGRQVYKEKSYMTDKSIGSFNKDQSIYKYNENLTQKEIIQKKQSIPSYLTRGDTTGFLKEEHKVKSSNKLGKKEESLLKRKLKPGKKMNVTSLKFQPKPKKEVLVKAKRERRNIEYEQKRYKLLSKEDRKLLVNNDWSVNRHNLNYVQIEKERLGESIQEEKSLIKKNKNEFFNIETFESEYSKPERLSKRLARLGVCSRRHAERIIDKGIIKVDGKTVFSNVPVTVNNNIQIFTKKGYQMPINEAVKVYVLYKPQGYVCSSKDIRNRPNIYSLLSSQGVNKHLIPVGPLDYSSEGLVLLTNSGEMAQTLEKNKEIERTYKIRVFGRLFTKDKLDQIRTGIRIRMRLVRYWVELISKQNTNTWIHLKSNDNSIIDIRHVFRKLSLRVNRLIRISYGPFTLDKSKRSGSFNEVEIPRTVGNYVTDFRRYKLNSITEKVNKTRMKVKEEKEEFENKIIESAKRRIENRRDSSQKTIQKERLNKK